MLLLSNMLSYNLSHFCLWCVNLAKMCFLYPHFKPFVFLIDLQRVKTMMNLFARQQRLKSFQAQIFVSSYCFFFGAIFVTKLHGKLIPWSRGAQVFQGPNLVKFLCKRRQVGPEVSVVRVCLCGSQSDIGCRGGGGKSKSDPWSSRLVVE